MNNRYWVVAALAATVACHDAAIGQQTKATRTAIGPYWSGYANGVQGQYSSAQAACDARAALINWSTLTYTPLSDHKGNCVDSSGRALGWSFFGQHCPRDYAMKNYVEYSYTWFEEDGLTYGVYYGPNQYCESSALVVDRWHDKSQDQCTKFGNPIYPLSGAKQQVETLLTWSPFAPALSVTFDSRRKLPNSDEDPRAAFAPIAAPSFGGLWEGSMHKRLASQFAGNSGIGFFRIYQASRGAGNWVTFSRTSAADSAKPDSDVNDRLVALTSGWRYFDSRSQTQEDYDSTGLLKSITRARGGRLLYSYSDSATEPSVAPAPGLLIKVEDPFGRAVQFGYEQPEGTTTPRVTRVVDPDGQVIQISYDDSGNLSRLTWPDNTFRRFLYEHSGLPWALTGILDENNVRYSTYAYDQEGRAASTEYAGGANRYSLTYGVPPRWVTTETYDSRIQTLWRDHYWTVPQDVSVEAPNGTGFSLGASLIQGTPRVTTRSQPAGAGCNASSSRLTYDTNGNVVSKTDFNGTKSCHAYDLIRNLETSRIDGLSAEVDCSEVEVVGTVLPAESRKVSTRWHPDWQLPTGIAEPRKLITHVYNGQPDPFSGNATAICAPADALLPDGKPLPVLCKLAELATADSAGGSGLQLGGVPAATGDPFYENVSALLHMDVTYWSATIPDKGPREHLWRTAGTAGVSASQSRFGGASFQPRDGALTSSELSDFLFGSGDFTVEAWVYNASAPTRDVAIAAVWAPGQCSWFMGSNASSQLAFYTSASGCSGNAFHAVGTIPRNAWVHVAVSRSGSNLFFFIDGALVGTKAISGALTASSGINATIGAQGNLINQWPGYIDEVRITKRVARYTSNFTVSSTPFGESTAESQGEPSLIDVAAQPLVKSYTYNEHGQVLTARDPLNNLTTYTYHAETTADYTKGDLKSVTNPAGHATQYTRYDRSGRLLESVDANGTRTETIYTPRGWVKTVTVTPPGTAAQLTVYDYDGVGQLKKATLSDGTALEYTYDAAHRLRSIKDAAGNAVTYTLDNTGNRTSEELKDASGTLARNITRVYDALNRVQTMTGGTQ
jgi:YD repeat-containing protein